jgi:hypothetical protein
VFILGITFILVPDQAMLPAQAPFHRSQSYHQGFNGFSAEATRPMTFPGLGFPPYGVQQLPPQPAQFVRVFMRKKKEEDQRSSSAPIILTLRDLYPLFSVHLREVTASCFPTALRPPAAQYRWTPPLHHQSIADQ